MSDRNSASSTTSSPLSETSQRIVYEKYDSRIEAVISFRRVNYDEDFDRLYEWHQQPHVSQYWNLQISREAYSRHLKAFLADKHQTLYIGLLDGIPMSYWECYWAADDVIAACYEAKSTDQGVHLLIGPTSYIGKGYALPLLQAMTDYMFQHEETDKVVAEPDAMNNKMLYIFEKCGYQFQHYIDLPDKRAALLFCDRKSWRRS
ncbi:GNAT family N-acetyltransferase [Paenibacillus sp. L3-i20]|uniref:GNAT family N-acetyltransferase n=1 Tax=Paenibacillus sp. L3-i20 TaxID=2905833 RepID=UPI001EDF6F4B|nr:GNAT family N-acetyltransferase [Paenibacillus sp. L3-i20]GKU76659.1 N-acetyltransferase [Paenibacillus sp. L3-i20]